VVLCCGGDVSRVKPGGDHHHHHHHIATDAMMRRAVMTLIRVNG
jgi:hypothetical protein